ncbi:Probable lipoprotein precursor [Tenacibaculum jejuense]|uniref:Probable lipoprotein n=2 Tax=Tenacibaculum jejuense TaxID=584609 RepID=A0A238UCC3_9FLAO|nr:Probable lipoprotein precursor [Tenacibaculum jejuense]
MRKIVSFLVVLVGFLSCQSNHKSEKMNNSLIVKESPLDFQTTYTQVKSKIENNPNLKLIFELDHSENASKKDLSLRPTKLLIFGNPNLGTPLMNVAPTLAIDLPQKIMIYEEAGKVFITYNNPEYLKERHNIEGKDELLNKISNALNKLTTVE